MPRPAGSALILALLTAGVAQAGGAAAPVAAQVQPATLAAVAAGLREAGLKVTLNPSDPDSDPSMTVISGSYELQVWLSDCKAGSCARVTASTAWDYSDEDDLGTDLVNEWNANYYTQAYVYEGSFYLDSTMPLRGGYTRAALKAWIGDYLGDVKEFGAELP